MKLGIDIVLGIVHVYVKGSRALVNEEELSSNRLRYLCERAARRVTLEWYALGYARVVAHVDVFFFEAQLIHEVADLYMFMLVSINVSDGYHTYRLVTASTGC